MESTPFYTQDPQLLLDYLAELKPIPLNGQQPDAESLAEWAFRNMDWHYRGDELAEKAVEALRAQGGSFAHPARRVRELAEAGDRHCAALIADMEAVPEWVDFDLMRRGGGMVQRHFPMMILALTYGGLPLTFAHPDAAAVFAGTGRMEANITRRLNESATLFFGVCNSDDLAPGRPMWEACLQVRLVHALVRLHLIEKGWDIPNHGVPVSQLATAAGPAFFGTHLLGCLGRLGARYTAEEAAGHCMIWRYVTRLLGVPEVLLGRTQAEQDEFDLHVTSLFFAPDETAKSVMSALISGLASQHPTSRIPGGLQLALFRRLLGDRIADAYGVPASAWGERMLNALCFVFSGYGRLQHLPPVAKPLRRAGQRILERLGTEGLVTLDVAGTHN